jgi:hypothetical protein
MSTHISEMAAPFPFLAISVEFERTFGFHPWVLYSAKTGTHKCTAFIADVALITLNPRKKQGNLSHSPTLAKILASCPNVNDHDGCVCRRCPQYLLVRRSSPN